MNKLLIIAIFLIISLIIIVESQNQAASKPCREAEESVSVEK